MFEKKSTICFTRFVYVCFCPCTLNSWTRTNKWQNKGTEKNPHTHTQKHKPKLDDSRIMTRYSLVEQLVLLSHLIDSIRWSFYVISYFPREMCVCVALIQRCELTSTLGCYVFFALCGQVHSAQVVMHSLWHRHCRFYFILFFHVSNWLFISFSMEILNGKQYFDYYQALHKLLLFFFHSS